MSYRRDITNVFDYIADDIETMQDEITEILDMDNIEDIKIAISELGQTMQTLKEELR